MKVNLNDLIECIEHEGELLTHYYNKKTGVIIYVEDKSTAAYKAADMDRIEEFEDWEKELITMLYDFNTNPKDYIKLPSKEELDEYNMMVQFINTIDNDIEKAKVATGKGNLRKLKEAIEDAGLLSEWYDYREDTEKNIALKWCNDNGIEYNS